MPIIEDTYYEHTLSILVFAPLFFALLALLHDRLAQWMALLGSLFVLSLSSYLLVLGYDHNFVYEQAWIPSLGIRYHIEADSLSLWLSALTSLLMLLATLFSFSSIKKRKREYYFFLLTLSTGMLGAFVAMDVFLFYLFWEAMLIPMYFLIGIFGGKERLYASIKFFIYTLIGSVLMLAAMLYLYSQTGDFSLDSWLGLDLSLQEQLWLFAAFAFAFAIKVPMFPVHTWLPLAHVQAPTAGSVILAGVLLKMGTYGFIRFAMPLFPEAVMELRFEIALLAVIGIVYGALVAMVQTDIKKLVAYSSVSHMGFVMLGLMALTPESVNGAIFQMLAHGISTGGLFILIGMLYDRTHTREIKDYGGLAKQMPWFTVVFLIVTFSSIGLPGTNGFVGEFLILSGSFVAGIDFQWLVLAASTGVILSAVYMLWMVERVFFGEMVHDSLKNLKDISWKEILIMFPFIALIFIMGIKPGIITQDFLTESKALIEKVKPNLKISLRK